MSAKRPPHLDVGTVATARSDSNSSISGASQKGSGMSSSRSVQSIQTDNLTASSASASTSASASAAAAKSIPVSPTSLSMSGAGEIAGVVSLLATPGTAGAATTDVKSFLAALTDERSAYTSVARSCLHLNQYAGSGSHTTTALEGLDSTSSSAGLLVTLSALFHDVTYAASVQSALSALTNCAQTHTDRRCRVLGTKTLALFARAAYGRLRHSHLLFSVREPTLGRLEDEIGGDVAVALCTVALTDADDGVSACAIEALGMLTLSTTSSASSSLDEDELLREIRGIISGGPSPYSPSLTMQETECLAPQSELQERIYENVMPARIRQLCLRVSLYHSPTHVARTIPFLTACLVHMMKISASVQLHLDKTAFAKRWFELDATGLASDFCTDILMPAMVDSSCSILSHAAALAALRLAHACPSTMPWVDRMCDCAAIVLMDVLTNAEVMEYRCATLATLLIAIRPLSVTDRPPVWTMVADELRRLPCTVMMPPGCSSSTPSLFIQTGTDPLSAHTRRPLRVGLWTELALSIFIDGPRHSKSDAQERSEVLGMILNSGSISKMLSTRSSAKTAKTSKGVSALPFGPDLAEEAVLVFCTVATMVGKRLLAMPHEKALAARNVLSGDVQEWIRCALMVLQTFSSCLNWRCNDYDASSSSDASEKMTDENDAQSFHSCCAAARSAYTFLFQQCMHTMGLLHQTSSVTLNLISEPDLTGALTSLEPQSTYISSSTFARSSLGNLTGQLVEFKLREGVSSRNLRVRLLALVSDHWVQMRHLTIESSSSSSSSNGTLKSLDGKGNSSDGNSINEMHAREMLSMLATEIVNLLELEGQSPSNNSSPTSSRKDDAGLANSETEEMAYLLVCIACVENMALVAHAWGRYRAANKQMQGSSRRKGEAAEDDSGYIVSVAMAVLKGQKVPEDGKQKASPKTQRTKWNEQAKSAMVSKCVSAANRVQAVLDGVANQQRQLGSLPGWGAGSGFGPESTYSAIVTQRAGRRSDITDSAWLPQGQTKAAQVPASVHHRPFLNSGQRLTVLDPYSGRIHLTGRITEKNSMDWNVADSYDAGYILQHCRQIILSRIDAAIFSSPLREAENLLSGGSYQQPTFRRDANGDGSSALTYVSTRPRNWLRLETPSLPSCREAHHNHEFDGQHVQWADSVTSVMGASDPVDLTLAYEVRKCSRYDGEVESKLGVTLRLYNITAVSIMNGVRLDLSVKLRGGQNLDFDSMTSRILTSLGKPGDATTDASFSENQDECTVSTTAIYKQELKPGDYLTWEVLFSWPMSEMMSGGIELCPSVSFRDMEVEQSTHKWLGLSAMSPAAIRKAALSNVTEGNESVEDINDEEGFSTAQESDGEDIFGAVEGTAEDDDENMDICLIGQPIPVPPMIMLHPCPLVFFRDGLGDEEAFRFLWFRQPHRVSLLTVGKSGSDGVDVPTAGDAARALAEKSTISLLPDGGTEGESRIKAFAFMSWSGKRVFIVLSTHESNPDGSSGFLEVRGDDTGLLFSLVGSRTSRETLVSDLSNGAYCCFD